MRAAQVAVPAAGQVAGADKLVGGAQAGRVGSPRRRLSLAIRAAEGRASHQETRRAEPGAARPAVVPGGPHSSSGYAARAQGASSALSSSPSVTAVSTG